MPHPTRKQTRLQDYDYSTPGAYFVTICTENRRCILSDIVVGADALGGPTVRLTNIGRIVEKYILSTERIRGLRVDKYCIMPNHVHMILIVEPDDGPPRASAPTGERDDGPPRASAPTGERDDGPQRASAPTGERDDGPPRASAPTVGRNDRPPRASAPTGERDDGPPRASAPTGGRNDGSPRASAPTGGRNDGPPRASAPVYAAIPNAVGALKRLVDREAGKVVFQRSYHDHVIRRESDYREIWAYIDENPAKWAEDRYFET